MHYFCIVQRCVHRHFAALRARTMQNRRSTTEKQKIRRLYLASRRYNFQHNQEPWKKQAQMTPCGQARRFSPPGWDGWEPMKIVYLLLSRCESQWNSFILFVKIWPRGTVSPSGSRVLKTNENGLFIFKDVWLVNNWENFPEIFACAPTSCCTLPRVSQCLEPKPG